MTCIIYLISADINTDSRVQEKIDDMMKTLEESTIPKALPEENIKLFNIHWSENGKTDPKLFILFAFILHHKFC